MNIKIVSFDNFFSRAKAFSVELSSPYFMPFFFEKENNREQSKSCCDFYSIEFLSFLSSQLCLNHLSSDVNVAQSPSQYFLCLHRKQNFLFFFWGFISSKIIMRIVSRWVLCVKIEATLKSLYIIMVMVLNGYQFICILIPLLFFSFFW